MTPGRDALEAAEQYRSMQLAVRAAFLAEFAELWSLVDAEDLDGSVPLWLRSVWPLLREWFATSARGARDYYPRAGGDPAYLPEVSLDTDKALGSLLVTGPGAVRTALNKGRRPGQAHRDGLASVSRSGGRLVLEGGRSTLEQAGAADPAVTRWMRVTDGDPCAFCAMLASRGAVYRSARSAIGTGRREWTDLARFHDGCGCQAVPVVGEIELPATSRRLARLWDDATQGLSGKEALRAFRRTLEEGTAPGVRPGAVDRSQVRNLRQHELDTARRLAELGSRVEFLPAGETVRTPDAVVDGQRWEFKSATGASAGTVTRLIRSAQGQSTRVVVDVSDSPITRVQAEQGVNDALRRYDSIVEVWLIGQGYQTRIGR